MKNHSMSNRAGCGLLLLVSFLVVGPAWGAPEALPNAACMRPSCQRVPVIMLQRIGPSISPAQAAFNRADTDHDGRLTRQEAEHFPAMAPHFLLIDTNGDSFLSFEELMRAATDHS